MKISERFHRLTFWNKLGVVSAVLSIIGIPISYYITDLQNNKPPASLIDIEIEAYNALHGSDFKKSLHLFQKALELDIGNSLFWEGNAYSYIGLAYPQKTDLNRVWDNFNLTGNGLCKELVYACQSSMKALDTAKTKDEQIRANLVLGLVLELQGYDDGGATQHGLSPLFYYCEAEKIVYSMKRELSAPRKISAIHYTPYPEVVRYAILNRLKKKNSESDEIRYIGFFFRDNLELRDSYIDQIKAP